MKKILYTKPSIGDLEKKYVYDAIANGWGEHCYDYIFKFQDAYKEYLNVNYTIATSSCTGALHIALKSLGIGLNDEVIIPDATWIASVSPITYVGAKPVFVDVLESTWCIDPKKIEEAITSKTKAIIAVHLYGNMCEMDEIMALAKKHNLYVIEDSAEAIGSEYKGKKAGSIGDFGVFSFHGTKTITTGEGGMLVSNNKALYEKAMVLHDHGRDPKVDKMFWCEEIGFKYKMSNLQAALGFAQMQRIEELVERKIEIFNEYKEAFSDIGGIQFNEQQNYVKNSYWMPTIVFDEKLNINRDELIDFLQKSNIDARVFFHPVSSFNMFEKSDNNISYRLGKNGINLPSYINIELKEIFYISERIKRYLYG